MTKNRARHRRIVTSIHGDAWFKSLPPGARNLFFNLIPYVGTSGAQRASIEQLAKLTGYHRSMVPMWFARLLIRRQLKQLSEKVKYWADDEIVWVKNFTKLQGNGEKFIAGAKKHAENFPEAISAEIIGYICKTDTLSDTLSDTVSDTHAHGPAHARAHGGALGTEEQRNRGTEEQRNRETESPVHLYTEQSRAKSLIFEYLKNCPTGLQISPDIKSETLGKKIEMALDSHPVDWWIDVFTRASRSDYLTGKVKGGDGRLFRIKFGWIIKPDIAAKISAGEYDNHNQGTQVDRDPSADWDKREVVHA